MLTGKIFSDQNFDQELLDFITSKEIKVISGHFGYNLWLPIKGKKMEHLNLTGPVYYYTLLRSPLEWATSCFYYSYKHHYLLENVDEWLSVLKKYCTQTLFVSGGSGDLNEAKYNLINKFAAFGITDRFDESFQIIRKYWGLKSEYSIENVTPKRPKLEEIPDKIKSLILEMLSADVELYNFANQMLDERIKNEKL